LTTDSVGVERELFLKILGFIPILLWGLGDSLPDICIATLNKFYNPILNLFCKNFMIILLMEIGLKKLI
tara:strand:+ start:354 stop:560 length:207 start_codon:yes stop_codon:yes gene_type:complete